MKKVFKAAISAGIKIVHNDNADQRSGSKSSPIGEDFYFNPPTGIFLWRTRLTYVNHLMC
jgi:hypothetical protein